MPRRPLSARPRYEQIEEGKDIFGEPRPSKFLRDLWRRTKNGARKRNLEFDLPRGLADALYHAQNGRCAVTGFAFNLDFFPEALVPHPFAPSIDRRLSSGGYTVDNVRLVCVAVNFGMGEWGEEVFMTLARAAAYHEQQQKMPVDVKWRQALQERLTAAEELLEMIPPESRIKQKHHIAGLKSALNKGLAGTRSAAAKAKITSMRERRPPQQ